MVTMPEPMSMLTDFWLCASRQPESAVSAFAAHRPMIVVTIGLMEDERTMSGLLPVARMARPSRVLRNSPSSTAASAAASSATISLYCPASALSPSSARIFVKTVCVLFMFRTEAPPITAMLTE